MALHFVGSSRNHAGKSWFIRAAVEYFRTLAPVAVVDASFDKLLGNIYSPQLNRHYPLRFDRDSFDADRLIGLANREFIIMIKVPAYDLAHFELWIETIDLSLLNIPIYYWFVNTGLDCLSPKVASVFKNNCFIVNNEYYIGRENGKFMAMDTTQLSLPKFGLSAIDSKTIELSQQGLSDLTGDISSILLARIDRFLIATFRNIESAMSNQLKLSSICKQLR